MQITLKTRYKSLEPFDDINLPNFVILTGLNGSGKTQILSAINENKCQVRDGDVLLPDRSLVTNLALSLEYKQQAGSRSFNNAAEGFFSQYQTNIAKLKNQRVKRLLPITISEFQLDANSKRKLESIIQSSGKEIDKLEVSDFHKYYPIYEELDLSNLFHYNLSLIFKKYHEKFDANLYNRFKVEQGYTSSLDSLSDEEFTNKNGSRPWITVNQILEEAKLDYRVNSPERTDRDTPFVLKLTNKINNADIDLRDLSSGEQVLMSLVFALYSSKFETKLPDILLMDEPDASLHPLMIKQLLDVILKVFVGAGVRVIITTHSPSTIALAPEEAIFVVNKNEPRIEKATKDQSLKILTTGVPSFSVNYENRRQVFVESQNDVEFYEAIYDKLKAQLNNDISLYFISSGIRSKVREAGDCSKVKDIVKTLVGFGNRSIFGIIDWDGKNKSEPDKNIFVSGEDKRYSIENYLYDPLLMSALLLQEKIATREELDLNNNENIGDFEDLPDNHLQGIADFFIRKIATPTELADPEKTTVQYFNRKSINIPTWYLRHQGHTLEDRLFEIPQLGRFKHKGLKNVIIEKVIDDIPEFIPIDLFILFQTIQQA